MSIILVCLNESQWEVVSLSFCPSPAWPALLMDEVVEEDEPRDRFGCPTTSGFNLPA
jgi:hypothetical protein